MSSTGPSPSKSQPLRSMVPSTIGGGVLPLYSGAQAVLRVSRMMTNQRFKQGLEVVNSRPIRLVERCASESLVWWPRSDQCRRITGNDSPLPWCFKVTQSSLPLTPSDSSGPRCAHTLLHQLKSKCHHRHRDEHAQSALTPHQTCKDYESPPRRETVVACSDEAVTTPDPLMSESALKESDHHTPTSPSLRAKSKDP